MRKPAIRTIALAAALAGALSLTTMACSSDDTTSSTDTTAIVERLLDRVDGWQRVAPGGAQC